MINLLKEQKVYLQNQLSIIQMLEDFPGKKEILIDAYIYWQQQLFASSIKIAISEKETTAPTLERNLSTEKS